MKELEFKKPSEMIADYSSYVAEKKANPRWGDWEFDPECFTLEYLPNGYWMPLGQIKDSATMLDWIFQLKDKSWAKERVMFDLLSAFRDLFHPQSTCCGQGIDRKFDPVAAVGGFFEHPFTKLNGQEKEA